MRYCTLDDLLLSRPAGDIEQLAPADGGGIDSVIVEEMCLKASSLIESFLPSPIPGDDVPRIIQLCAIDLSIFYLYERMMGTEMPESVNQLYTRSLKLLEKIQNGKIQIGLNALATPESSGGNGYFRTNKTTDDRLFGSTTWEAYL